MMRRLAISLLVFLCGFLLWFGCMAPAAAQPRTDWQTATQLWQGSAHALNDINCSSCHQAESAQPFVAQPDYESCRSCHEQAVDTFLLGKHGIRLLEGQSPLTPAMARLPMAATAQDQPMTCNTCHDVHSVNTVEASVDSCLGCHADTHSLNYARSKHATLFAADQSLPRPSAASVSCATCHLPRHSPEDSAAIWVNHNNTYTLLPRDRMVKEVCMNCHGVEFAFNSIFDDALVEANFARPPEHTLQTFDLMRALETRRSGTTDDPQDSSAD